MPNTLDHRLELCFASSWSMLEGFERDRETFVVVADSPDSTLPWKKIALLLRELGHHVVVVTQAVAGDRLHLADHFIDDARMAETVFSLLENRDLMGVTLICTSTGGRIIANVAERVPERLKQLIVLDSVPPPRTAESLRDQSHDVWKGNDIHAGEGLDRTGLGVFHASVNEFVQGLSGDRSDVEWVLATNVEQPVAIPAQPTELDQSNIKTPLAPFILRTEKRGSAA